MIELTSEQHETLRNDAGPIRALDLVDNTEYVLLRREVYDKIQQIVEDEDWAACAYRAALEVFARDGWADPEMDAYDALDPRRQPRTSFDEMSCW